MSQDSDPPSKRRKISDDQSVDQLNFGNVRRLPEQPGSVQAWLGFQQCLRGPEPRGSPHAASISPAPSIGLGYTDSPHASPSASKTSSHSSKWRRSYAIPSTMSYRAKVRALCNQRWLDEWDVKYYAFSEKPVNIQGIVEHIENSLPAPNVTDHPPLVSTSSLGRGAALRFIFDACIAPSQQRHLVAEHRHNLGSCQFKLPPRGWALTALGEIIQKNLSPQPDLVVGYSNNILNALEPVLSSAIRSHPISNDTPICLPWLVIVFESNVQGFGDPMAEASYDCAVLNQSAASAVESSGISPSAASMATCSFSLVVGSLGLTLRIHWRHEDPKNGKVSWETSLIMVVDMMGAHNEFMEGAALHQIELLERRLRAITKWALGSRLAQLRGISSVQQPASSHSGQRHSQ